MNPLVKNLGTPSTDAASFAPSSSVVRVQARFGNTWAAAGSGFFIGQWPSSVSTARHVVALPQGIAPTDVKVEAFVAGRWTRFDVTTIAFPPVSSVADDVAIVRIHGTCTSSLQAATMDGPCRVEIWGYPLAAGRSSGAPSVVASRASPMPAFIRLDRPGRPGMSGGPVVAISESGQPIAAVGIYLGTSRIGAKAHVLIADSVFASKDAAMNSTLSGNPYESR
jgi:S1-C subfamily serine protease